MPNDLPSLAPAPAGTSSETLAAADAQFAKVGYSEEQRAAAGYRPGAATPPPSNSGSDAPPAPSYSPTANVSPEHKASAIQNLVAKGVITADDAPRLARAEGIDPAMVKIEAATAPPADPLSLQQANAKLAETSDPLSPSTSPSDYGAFHFDSEHIADMAPDELAALNSVFADAFHEAQYPRLLGQALVNQMMSTAARFTDLNEVERQLVFKEEGARLRRLGNVEQIVENAEFASSHLPEWFKEFADENFLFHSAEAYAALAHAGEQMRMREARRK